MLRWIWVRIGAIAFPLLAGALAVAQTPAISSISPNPGGIGQSVTISGTNFGSLGSVKFNGVAASTISWSATTIIATIPVGATSGNVVVIPSGGQPSNEFPFTLNNGPVNYIYDALGRLVAAIDAYGNAAEYSYDAVGNIQNISVFTAVQVSIANFTPTSGPVGTVVTINGTGFSSTPSQNSVQFDGTSATVSSATNTQLQVTVPAAAATGPISVTCPNGSATSSLSFTVSASTGVPDSPSFSPGSGVAGTAVSVVGKNFDPTLANDKLRLNVSPAAVSAVTSTTISATVPAATASGPFTLVAPEGTSVSSQNFYVPFGSHTAAEIGVAENITPGKAQTVSLAGEIALLVFDSTSVQSVSVEIADSTFKDCTLFLIAPNNSIVNSVSFDAAKAILPSTSIVQSGYYTLGIDPGINSGSLKLLLSTDVEGTIAINGPPVTVTTTVPGQGAHLSFDVAPNTAPGQAILISATSVTTAAAILNLVQAGGTVQSSVEIKSSPAGQTFYLSDLVMGGTYQLWVEPVGSSIGSETLQITSSPADFTGTLDVPGAGTAGTATQVPTTGTLATGQNANLTFSGTAGQTLSFNVKSSTIGTSGASCLATLYDPNLNPLSTGYCGKGSDFIDAATLDVTGTYTLFMNPLVLPVGSAAVSVNNDQTVTAPAISIGGKAVTAKTTVAGQDIRLSFTATQVEPVTVVATDVTNASATMNLVSPSGTVVASTSLDNTSGQTFLLNAQLATTGTYQLWIQHSKQYIGKETLQIVAGFTGTLTVPGPGLTGPVEQVPTTGNLTKYQNASLTFSGTAGQVLSFNLLNSTIGTETYSCVATIYNPALAEVRAGDCGPGASTIGPITLADTGTYTFYIAPQGGVTGSVGISVNNDSPFTGTLTVPAPGTTGPSTQVPTTGNLVFYQDANLTFSGNAGQQLSFNVLNSTIGTSMYSCYAYLYNPSQQIVANGYCGEYTGNDYLDTVALNATGTYTFNIQPQNATGNLAVSINNAQTVTTPSIAIGGSAVTATTTVAGQDVQLSFTSTAAQHVAVVVTNVTNPGATLNVVAPSGAVIASTGINNNPAGQTFILSAQLTGAGTFQLWVQHSGTNFGSETLQIIADYTATLTVPSAGTTGPAIQVPTTGNLLVGQNANLTFGGTTGQTLSFNLVNSTIGSAYYDCGSTIYDPHGNNIGGGWCGGLSGDDLVGPVTLAASGTFSLYLSPGGGVTGNVSVSVNNDQPVTATTSIGGPPVTVTTVVAGQSANITFSGTANQIITVLMSNDTFPGCAVTLAGVNITIYNPDGSTLTSYFCQGGGYLPRITLPQNGTYTLNLQPGSWTYTGSMTFTLYNVVDVDTTITPGGAPVTVTTTVVGQYANLTFSGSPGEIIALGLTNGTYPGCGLFTGGITVSIYNPDGSVLTQAGCLGTPYFFPATTLAQTGTYTITVNPTPYTGSVTLTLYGVPPPITGSITIGGPGFSFTTVVGQTAEITFSNPTLQTVVIQWTAGTYSSCNLTVTSSAGTQEGSTGCSGASGSLTLSNLASDTYTILIAPGGTSTGGLTISAAQ